MFNVAKSIWTQLLVLGLAVDKILDLNTMKPTVDYDDIFFYCNHYDKCALTLKKKKKTLISS